MRSSPLVVLAMFAMTGCVTTRIVERPAVDKVHKVAIVSVYSNYQIGHVGGSSGPMGEAQGLASMFGGKKDKNEAADRVGFGGTTLVEFAERELRDQLAKVSGWEVIEPKDFVNQSYFKEFVAKGDQKTGAEKMTLSETSTRHPQLAKFPILVKNAAKEAELKELAAKIGADAVVVLSLNIAYDTSSGIGSTGTALAVVNPNLLIVNNQGQLTVHEIGDYKFRSKTTVAMVGGSIIFNKKSEGMFEEAIGTGLAYYPTRINKDLEETK